jgi:hypothetical protein
MTRKAEQKPKLTDAERHKRFVDMAREVEASPDPKDFERAFKKIIPSSPSQRRQSNKSDPAKSKG